MKVFICPHPHPSYPFPSTLHGPAFCQLEQKGPEAQVLGLAPPPCETPMSWVCPYLTDTKMGLRGDAELGCDHTASRW